MPYRKKVPYLWVAKVADFEPGCRASIKESVFQLQVAMADLLSHKTKTVAIWGGETLSAHTLWCVTYPPHMGSLIWSWKHQHLCSMTPCKKKKKHRPWVYQQLNNSHSFTTRSVSKKEGVVQTGGPHSGKFEHTIEWQ